MRLRAFRAELLTNVDAIRTAQLAHDAIHDSFVRCSSREQALVELSPSLRDWRGGPGWAELGWAPDGPLRGAYWTELSPDERSFEVHGVMDADGDGKLAEAVATSDRGAELVTPESAF
jgi:hypothetical protein